MKQISSLFVAVILLLNLCACTQSAEERWQEQYDLGVRYLSEGNYEEAIIAFTAAIEIDAKRPEGFIGRGDAYIGSGETEDNLAVALSDYETALTLDEMLAGAWLGLADVYIRQGDYEKALDVLKEALTKTYSDQSIADKIAEIEGGEITDSSGNVRRMNSYDESGNLIWYHTYTYDSQGREDSVTSFNGTGRQTGHVKESYNENEDRLVSHHYWGDTGEVGAIRYAYDSSDNAVREEWYSPEGSLYKYYLNTFDAQENCVRQDQYGPDGESQGYRT